MNKIAVLITIVFFARITKTTLTANEIIALNDFYISTSGGQWTNKGGWQNISAESCKGSGGERKNSLLFGLTCRSGRPAEMFSSFPSFLQSPPFQQLKREVASIYRTTDFVNKTVRMRF